MLKRLIFFLIVMCSVPVKVTAQQPLVRHYTVQDGLPSNVIYDVYQDSKGFIWFCTDQGISRFDGNEFRNYSIKDGLPDTEVFRIREDGEHRYWLICYNNRACYLLDDKIYSNVNDALCRRIEQLGIRYDDMFVSLSGVYCLVGNKIGMLTGKSPHVQLWPGFDVEYARIYPFRSGNAEYIYVRSNMYNLTTGYSRNLGKAPIVEACHGNGNFFLFKGDGEKQTVEQWKVTGGDIHLVSKFCAPSRIHGMFLESPDRLLCCTEKGVLVCNPTTGKFEHDKVFPAGIRCNRLLVDRQGNRWLITLSDGVYFSAGNSNAVINVGSGLSGNNILSLFRSPNGELIAGDDAGNINLIGKGGIRTFKVSRKDGTNRILFIRDLDRHTLIIGGDQGLFAIDRRSMTCRKVFTQAFKTGLLYDTHFFAGHSNGMVLYHKPTGKTTEKAGFRVSAMAMDQQGILWMATTKGVLYYKEGRIYPYSFHPVLNESRVSCMALSADGHMLLGTSANGLFIVKNPLLPPLHLQQSDGLSSNNCKQLFAAKDHVIWLSSESGVDRLYTNGAGGYTINPFPLPDIISGNKINDLQEDAGQLYLATSNGIVILDTHDTAVATPPRLYIEAINGNVLSESQRNNSQEFSYNERNIQVSYTGISFSGGSKLQYRYLLHGGSADTLYTGARSVNFSALPRGTYQVMLWVRNAGSIWTAQPVRLVFSILPPFWLHPFFLLQLVSLPLQCLFYFTGYV